MLSKRLFLDLGQNDPSYAVEKVTFSINTFRHNFFDRNPVGKVHVFPRGDRVEKCERISDVTHKCSIGVVLNEDDSHNVDSPSKTLNQKSSRIRTADRKMLAVKSWVEKGSFSIAFFDSII